MRCEKGLNVELLSLQDSVTDLLEAAAGTVCYS